MPWHDNLDDDLRSYVVGKGLDKQTGDAAAAGLAKSYRELEGRIGRSVVLPEKEDAPEWDAVWKRLEAPLAARETARRTADEAAAAEMRTKTETEQQAALDKEWGADKEKRQFLASKAAEALGWDADTLKAVLATRGIDKGMNDLYNLGVKMGEPSFQRGNLEGRQVPKDRNEARVERNRLMSDTAFAKKVMDGDADALKQLNDLSAAILGTQDNWQPAPRNFGRTRENPTGE